MKELDKRIFLILLITILILIGFITFSYFKQKGSVDIFSSFGNDIVKNINDESSISVDSKVYERENVKISYPYIEGVDSNVNDEIKDFVVSKTNTYNNISINYDVKFKNLKLVSIIFYGTLDDNNYSEVLNLEINSGNIISSSDIFIDKYEPVVILKSKYTSDYLEKNGNTLKLDYIDSKTYTELLDNDDINIYFTKDGIGVIMCNVPKILGDYYINVEVKYSELNNYFIEKQVNSIEVNEENIKNFLLNGLISESKRVEDYYPQGLVFTENGNFSYNIGEVNPTYDGELLSYRGNWWLESNKLVLHVLEEEHANNFVSDIDYKKTVNKVDYVIEYNIDRFYKSYVVINNYELIFNSLKIENSYIEKYRVLADAGYNEFNKIGA